MEFRELKTFQVVANLLSFNQAADVLHLAQSTVSAQIRSLENSLGKELFIRMGKKIQLSPEGIKLLSYTQRLVNIEKEIRAAIGNLDDDHSILKIKTPQSVTTYFFPNLIREFQMLFPNTGFDLDWCTSYNLPNILHSGTTDLAFLITDAFNEKALNTELLMDIEMCLVAKSSHQVFELKNHKVEDLDGQTLIYVKSDCNYHNILDRQLIQSSVKPKKLLDINSFEAVKDLILDYDGIAYLPKMLIHEELNSGVLRCLNWKGKNIHTKLIMIWPKEKHISKALDAFMMMVREQLKNEV